jgi:peroxiredoxin
MTQEFARTLQPGDRAPDFMLTAVQTDRTVSLSDYRNRSALFLALFRGLYCPFCRRAIAQMAASIETLKPLGIESLGVVATELENARLYYRFRPMRLPLAVDPALTTHRSYGVPKLDPAPEFLQAMGATRVNPTGELPAPLPIGEAAQTLNRLDGYQWTDVDHRDEQGQFPLLEGQFLIDREGIIRWVNVECGAEGPAGIGKFPTLGELLPAAQMAISA